MMSHRFLENIFMSPLPSFEIQKMNGFRNNTDSFSILNGEYLLESSLHPAPVSLWLDFRYKEKKKQQNRSGRGNKRTNNTNNRTDIALFYFTSKSTVVYSATKFMFSFNFSRNYRHLDTKQREFYLGLFLVQNVLGFMLSTSCVRIDFQRTYFSQYSFYALKNFTRQLFSHAPIFSSFAI